MGKSKQGKEKKFDRNVEISAPILDPEIIKAIHSAPKGGRLDIRHAGFKALLADLNSQDSTDELAPLNDNHIPSYIGISCAVSGYSNYSAYTKQRSSSPTSGNHQQPALRTTTKGGKLGSSLNRSQTNSPAGRVLQPDVHHITIDKSNVQSVDEERKELTEKLTASATERRRSPSPITPTEDDRHHGAYVGARYCPLPPPDKLVNKHIPLLGIDDDRDPDEVVEEPEKKVEHKIASLYGDNFVEDWRESMTHKVKKELSEEPQSREQSLKSPKDLVILKPTPVHEPSPATPTAANVDLPPMAAKVLAGVEKQFLNKLLTDDNPPMPKSPSPVCSPVRAEPVSPVGHHHREEVEKESVLTPSPLVEQHPEPSPVSSPSPEEEAEEERVATMSPDSGKSQSFLEEHHQQQPAELSQSERREEHIEYEIRAQSPLDNQASPTKLQQLEPPPEEDLIADEELLIIKDKEHQQQQQQQQEHFEEKLEQLAPVEEPTRDVENLVSFSPEAQQLEEAPSDTIVINNQEQDHDHVQQEEKARDGASAAELVVEQVEAPTLETTASDLQTLQEKEIVEKVVAGGDNDGRYYLGLLDQEKSFILEQISMAEQSLKERESELDEDTLGKIHSAIGKANLLINKKCKQFEGLCESNNKSKGSQEEVEQFAVLNDDLAGFWDMLNIQIVDVKRSFESLRKEAAL